MLFNLLFYVIGNCDAISYYKKTLREDAQTAEMELIAAQYRGRARVLQAKLFVMLSMLFVKNERKMNKLCVIINKIKSENVNNITKSSQKRKIIMQNITKGNACLRNWLSKLPNEKEKNIDKSLKILSHLNIKLTLFHQKLLLLDFNQSSHQVVLNLLFLNSKQIRKRSSYNGYKNKIVAYEKII